MYFVISELAIIDPMYQYSLQTFTRLFNAIIYSSKKSSKLEKRLAILIDQITENVFMNVCRGLFNEHKLIFSFIMSVKIQMKSGLITNSEWMFLLKGVTFIPAEFILTENPKPDFFTDLVWRNVLYL